MACNALPDEIILKVQAHLTPAECARTGQLNRQWQRCAEDEPYWRRAFQRDCLEGERIARTPPDGIPFWRDAYAIYARRKNAQSHYSDIRSHTSLMPRFRRLLIDDLASMFDPSQDLPTETVIAGLVVLWFGGKYYFGREIVKRSFIWGGAGFAGTALSAFCLRSWFLVHCLTTGIVAVWGVGTFTLGPTFAATQILRHIPQYCRAWRDADEHNAAVTARLESAVAQRDQAFDDYAHVLAQVRGAPADPDLD